jgi:hypothetical protein
MAPSKFLLAALATFLIAIGIAAQTGTVHVARPAQHPQAATVGHAPAVAAQAPRPQVVRPAPPVPPPPQPAAAPVQSDGDQGDGGGDGGGD